MASRSSSFELDCGSRLSRFALVLQSEAWHSERLDQRAHGEIFAFISHLPFKLMSLASVGLRTYARGSKLSSSAQLREEECHAPAETTTLCLGKSLRATWTFVLLLSLQGIYSYRGSTKISPPLTSALDETLVCGIRAWRGSCRLVKDLHDARRQQPSHWMLKYF